MTQEDYRAHPMWEEEHHLEMGMTRDGEQRMANRDRNAIARGEESAVLSRQKQIRLVLGPTVEAILADRAAWVKRGGSDVGTKIMTLLDAETVAFITAKVTFDQVTRPQSLQSLAVKIGHALETELRFRKYREQGQDAFDALWASQTERNKGRRHKEYAIRAIMEARGATFEAWPVDVQLHVGMKCVDLFAQAQSLVAIHQPARVPGKRHVPKVVQLTDEGIEWFQNQDKKNLVMYPVFMPMVMPPKPWDAVTGGGYYCHTLKIVRTPFAQWNNYLSDSPCGPEVYKAVNAIQETAWKINKPILAVMREAWANKSEIGGLPKQDAEPVPSKPTTKYVREAQEWTEYRKLAAEVHDRNTLLYGERLVVQHALLVADRMERYPAIYFPQQLDFRGRVYPTPVYLHPQDADFSRAMLTFSEGKPLGKDGAYWLAVHGANCWGEDKVSLDDRVKWVEKNSTAIINSAKDPLGVTWWADADKPWQFLAFCFEWREMKRCEAARTAFVSHLPVDMDGTCNGLQHFSAMLRDEVGGEAVNLTASGAPQDIYQRVANRVNDALMESSAPSAGAWLAFGIDRKITKRSVMIMPYGGTMHSCMDYVKLAVAEKESKTGRKAPTGKMALVMLSVLVWQAIGEEVTKSREAMRWLRKVAVLMTAKKLPVTWTTPAGFRAMQLYPKMEMYRVNTFLEGQTIKMALIEATTEIDRDAQYTGISPNFVHSMDGSALMVTVNHCRARGITAFHMVHDSYGTHAADTGVMGELLRGAFYQMYKDHDPLAELRDAVLLDYPGEDVPPVPLKGSLDLSQVLKSRYFFA